MNIQDIADHEVLLGTDAGSFGLTDCDEDWRQIRDVLRGTNASLPHPWEGLFGKLRAGTKDDLVVISQIGQSIDGRLATTTGKSHCINGRAGLVHLHRLRAVVDAVVIGIGTICADNPQLTVRHVRGANPARVVLDPHGRLSSDAHVLAPTARRIIVTSEQSPCNLQDVDILRLPAMDGCIAPSAILSELAQLGLRRILVEGGADTISRFLQAGCLDRLHVIVAPLILGAGRPSFAFGAIDRLEDALRPPTRVYRLGDDILFDFDLSGTRVPIWRSKNRYDQFAASPL
jgi:diaminohydroxyphosphoribosylaminopyrimidine deaminase / 5-amino-6-(5-phosphoribosylamino)uracil reductase